MKSELFLLFVALLCISSVRSFRENSEISKIDADLFLEDDEGSGAFDDNESNSPGLGQDDEDVVIPVVKVKAEDTKLPYKVTQTTTPESETTHVHVHVHKHSHAHAHAPKPTPPAPLPEVEDKEIQDEESHGFLFSSHLVILPSIICGGIFVLVCSVLLIYRCRMKRDNSGNYEVVLQGKQKSDTV